MSATIMMGAVTETKSLRETVETLERICKPSDVAEIIIGYSPHRTRGCKATIDALTLRDFPIPLNIFVQEKPFMSGIEEMINAATGSHCILVASDMALDLECVNDMIANAKLSPETIYSCSRFLKGCTMDNYGALKKIVNLCAQRYIRILYGKKLTDFTNPYQIVPTELYQSIKFESIGFAFLLEMVLKPLRLGYKFVEIPTNCYQRKDGKSRNSKKQMMSYFKTSLHIRFMSKKAILKQPNKLGK